MRSDQFLMDFLIKCTLDLLFNKSARSPGLIRKCCQNYIEISDCNRSIRKKLPKTRNKPQEVGFIFLVGSLKLGEKKKPTPWGFFREPPVLEELIQGENIFSPHIRTQLPYIWSLRRPLLKLYSYHHTYHVKVPPLT